MHLTLHQAAANSILVFFAAIIKDRSVDFLIITVNRVVNYETMFSIIAERLLMQIIHHINKYTFQNFKSPDYCNLIKCLDVIISTASDLKAIADDSETLVLGQVVLLSYQGDVEGALSEAAKLNLATISNEETFVTLSHHICIALVSEGSFDSAVEYFTTTVLKMSLRRECRKNVWC